MNKKTLMLIAALTLGGAVSANAATPTATASAKPAKVHMAKKPAVKHHTAAKPKVVKPS
jgi:hypothetical protein